MRYTVFVKKNRLSVCSELKENLSENTDGAYDRPSLTTEQHHMLMMLLLMMMSSPSHMCKTSWLETQNNTTARKNSLDILTVYCWHQQKRLLVSTVYLAGCPEEVLICSLMSLQTSLTSLSVSVCFATTAKTISSWC